MVEIIQFEYIKPLRHIQKTEYKKTPGFTLGAQKILQIFKILKIVSYLPLPTCIGLTAPVAPPLAAWRCLNTWNLDGSGSLPQ
jgi:hypothetical protein